MLFDLSEIPRPVIRYGAGLWRRRWLIVCVAWISALVGWAAVYRLPDKYESEAHIAIQEARLNPLLKDVAARPDYQQRIDVNRISLKTYPNVEEMVYRAGLDADIEWVSASDKQAQLERLVNSVKNGISISSPRNMYLIIKYKNSDPEIAKKVVEAAVNILIEQDLGANLRESESSEAKIIALIADQDLLLSRQSQEISQYRTTHEAELAAFYGSDRARDRKRASLNDIFDNKSQVRSRVETLRARLASTPRVSAGGELADLKVQLSQLRSQYNDNYPDIQNLLQQITRLESDDALPDNPEYLQLTSELRSAQARLRGLERQEERVRTEIETAAVTSGQAPLVVAELERLERNFENTKNTYNNLVSGRDQLALRKTADSEGQGLEYTILEHPRKALVPTDPPRQLLILAVIVLAFGAGGALALALTFIERTYTQSADLEEAFGLPVLGAVSTVQTGKMRRGGQFDFLRLTAACSVLFLLCFVYIYVSVLRPQAVILKGGDKTEATAILEKGLR